QYGIQRELVAINTVISPELRDVVIRTDRNWMIKILSNLLINALEYSESDRIEVGAICHQITDTEVDLELYVADWGQGIDPSEKEFVFERFYRGESGVESGKHGTGLGLSICQEIAHAMGGHLRLEDNDPTGCRFVLKGKFDRVEGGQEFDKEAVLATLSGKRILVVDDLVYNRRSIVEFLQALGCQCDECESGRQALSMLDSEHYYLALLDWDLPGLTGPEIARRHRKHDPDDPVILIAVTAYTDGEKKRESVEAGMNGYISKPLTASRLAHCLGNIHNWQPVRGASSDVVDADEVQEEIYKHIEDCLLFGERYEWENLRRCAHRLTTLALIKNNKAMQQVCRDIQIAASEENIQEAHVRLLELHKWRKS
ncbi:MAG TPA: response regulator, partial [Oceanipulchritudo sp.]|nr:response regulator [Oceanipulchritudo sp.]